LPDPTSHHSHRPLPHFSCLKLPKKRPSHAPESCHVQRQRPLRLHSEAPHSARQLAAIRPAGRALHAHQESHRDQSDQRPAPAQQQGHRQGHLGPVCCGGGARREGGQCRGADQDCQGQRLQSGVE